MVTNIFAKSGMALLATTSLIIVALIIVVSLNGVVIGSPQQPQFPAMFVFGDSLVDNGNNNYLNSFAKSNYVPYGIDFNGGPSGRFCNGKTIIDFLGDLLGLPSYIPAFADASASGKSIINGVNYASAAAGILEETGQHLGDRYSLSQQVQNFESNLSELKNQAASEMELNQYLAKSLVVMILGSNDYINNYLVPLMYIDPISFSYNPQDYAEFLINRYSNQILALHSLGLRKFLLAGIGPLGCIPNQLATGLAPPGKCVSYVNEMVKLFNARLRTLVDQLNEDHPGAIFVYGNTYGGFMTILSNPTTYGFRVSNKGCCGIGRNRGQISCLPYSIPCMNRDQYVFWDAFHPTEAVNKIIANMAYTGSSDDCYPINVQQMALV